MPRQSHLAFFLLVVSSSAWAKPWNGIEPGVSPRTAVVEKLGEPSKTTTTDGKETLAYLKDKGIKGVLQVQVKLNERKVVERIDIFPALKLDREAIEESYGSECSQTDAEDEGSCYVRRPQGKQFYFFYAQLGLAVFFKDDADTVKSMAFLPGKK